MNETKTEKIYVGSGKRVKDYDLSLIHISDKIIERRK